MGRYVAFLRGMNLGKRRVKNPELIACFEELGMKGVEAFLASGNVVFEGRGSALALQKKLELGLKDTFNYEVPVFLRTDVEVIAAAQACPFASQKGTPQGGKLQVAFLRDAPSKGVSGALRSFETNDDWLKLVGSELYWWPSGGISQSELDLKRLEKLLGPMTIRTHGTVERLVAKYFC